jgi:exopolyphosphatase/pppGpp-phosphohydrolase
MGGKTISALRALPNLDPARADVMYAGTAIIVSLLRHYGAEEFTLVDRGLRFGLLLD